MEGVSPGVMRGTWRTEIVLRARELRHRLETAQAHGARDLDGMRRAEFDSHVVAVKDYLKDACNALRAREGARPWRRFGSWWSGTAITAAWDSIHGAEAALVAIEPADGLLATMPVLRLWMREVLPDSHKRRTYEAGLEVRQGPDRTLMRQVYNDTIIANSERYIGLRAFRNVLLAVAGGLALVIAATGIWHAIDPSFVSLCQPIDGSTHCFGDGGQATARAVFEIAMIGAAGGLLGSAFLLSGLERAPSRYNLLAPQLVLKVLAGAVTALLGVLLVQSGFVIHFTSHSDAELLGYAALFGFSQELLTQFVDKQAGNLLGAKSD